MKFILDKWKKQGLKEFHQKIKLMEEEKANKFYI